MEFLCLKEKLTAYLAYLPGWYMYEIDVRSAVCDEEDGWVGGWMDDGGLPISDIRIVTGR